MHQALRRGTRLTRDLLAFTRRSAVERPGGVCNGGAVCRDTVQMLTTMLPSSIRLTIDVPDTPFAVGIADYQLEQAIVNLATNARDAMNGMGTISVSVTHAQDRPGWVCVTVSDTGCGLDARGVARMGEPFETTKAEGQGAGLGLWSIRRMLDGAGGSWRVDSTLGRGTTVVMTLPPPPSVQPLRQVG